MTRRKRTLALVGLQSTAIFMGTISLSKWRNVLEMVLPQIDPRDNDSNAVKNAGHDYMEENSNNNFFGGIVARPFLPWPADRPLPCLPPEEGWATKRVQDSPAEEGFLYLKPFKTGSSTCSGINVRIARNVAARQGQNFTLCKARFGHGNYRYPAATRFANRTQAQSFLWTVIREPSARAVSQFFHFRVSRRNLEPSEANFRAFLVGTDGEGQRDYYLRSLYTAGRYNRMTHDPVASANQILQEYDFIGITERMDESAVVLMMLLRLQIADILHISSKAQGSYDDAGGPSKVCTRIQPSFLTPSMKGLLSSVEWQDRIQYDLALYKAANRSLDLTIDRLGRSRFQRNFNRYQRAKQDIMARCVPKVVFPCNSDGERLLDNETDCLWKDSGCGTTCLDEVASDLQLW